MATPTYPMQVFDRRIMRHEVFFMWGIVGSFEEKLNVNYALRGMFARRPLLNYLLIK